MVKKPTKPNNNIIYKESGSMLNPPKGKTKKTPATPKKKK